MSSRGGQVSPCVTEPDESHNPRPPARPGVARYPLAQALAGTAVRVRELTAPVEVAIRLRELGFCEQQRVRLLSKHTNIICQVCNVRLGLSKDLASMILVETIHPNGTEPGR